MSRPIIFCEIKIYNILASCLIPFLFIILCTNEGLLNIACIISNRPDLHKNWGMYVTGVAIKLENMDNAYSNHLSHLRSLKVKRAKTLDIIKQQNFPHLLEKLLYVLTHFFSS